MNEEEVLKIIRRKMRDWPKCCMDDMKFSSFKKEAIEIIIIFKCNICWKEREFKISYK